MTMRLRDRFDRSKRKPSTRTQRVGFAFLWLLVLAYAYFVSPNANFNTESHLFVAFSIVDHHTVNIDGYHQRLGDEAYARGHYYSDKAPGLAFLAAPIYAGLRLAFPQRKGTGYEVYSHMRYAIPKSTSYLRYAITYALVMLPSAVFAILLWLFLSQFTAGVGWPLFLTAAYALGTIAYPYSTWFFSHQITAILLFASFLLLYYHVRHRQPHRRMFLLTGLAGLLAGYAVISEYPTGLIAVLLAMYLLGIARSKALTLGAFAAGALPPALLNLWYNLAAFGKPLASGYMYVKSDMYQSHMQAGITALLSSAVRPPSLLSLWQITFWTYRGLFLVSPVLLLFFAGLAFMWRRRDLRPEFWLCVAVVALYFLMDASRGVDQNGWSGGWSVASRHLTPMLPFMIFPMVFGLRNRVFQTSLLILSALSIAIMFMTVATGAQFSFGDQNPLINEMLPEFTRGQVTVNWGYMLGLTGLTSLLPLFFVAAGLTLRLASLFRFDRPRLLQPNSLPLDSGRA